MSFSWSYVTKLNKLGSREVNFRVGQVSSDVSVSETIAESGELVVKIRCDVGVVFTLVWTELESLEDGLSQNNLSPLVVGDALSDSSYQTSSVLEERLGVQVRVNAEELVNEVVVKTMEQSVHRCQSRLLVHTTLTYKNHKSKIE